MITTVRPMSVDHARALSLAYELQTLLGELVYQPEFGEGSPVDDALNRMDDVIGMLQPEDDWPPNPQGGNNIVTILRGEP
jgi:hypothetical protein